MRLFWLFVTCVCVAVALVSVGFANALPAGGLKALWGVIFLAATVVGAWAGVRVGDAE